MHYWRCFNLLFCKFLPKTAWKWNNLDPESGAHITRAPLDPPLICNRYGPVKQERSGSEMCPVNKLHFKLINQSRILKIQNYVRSLDLWMHLRLHHAQNRVSNCCKLLFWGMESATMVRLGYCVATQLTTVFFFIFRPDQLSTHSQF